MIDWIKNRFWPRIRETVQSWQRDDGGLMAAAVAYYAALSFFPLLLVLVAGLGLIAQFTTYGQDAEHQLLSAIGSQASPQLEEQVQGLFEQVRAKAAVSGPLGMVVLMITAMAMFAHFERALDRIWNVPPSSGGSGIVAAVKNVVLFRLRAFLMLFIVGVLILVVFIAGLVMTTFEHLAADNLPGGRRLWWICQMAVTVALNSVIFGLIYRSLPKATVHWREAWRGGLFAAVIWEIGRQVLAAAVIGSKYDAYGVIGSFLAVMLWCYYAVTVIFLGAEFVQAISKERQLESNEASSPSRLRERRTR